MEMKSNRIDNDFYKKEQLIAHCVEEIIKVLESHKTSVYTAKIILKRVKFQICTKSLVSSEKEKEEGR